MKKYVLSHDEFIAITDLLKSVVKEYDSAEDERFLLDASLIAQDLPLNLRRFLHNYKQHEDTEPTCLISGYEIDNNRIGRSPKHWKDKRPNAPSLMEEIYFVLCASLIGNPIGWSTQQAGHIVHEIFPIKEHESDQLGFSSKEILEWHTEDAFHPLRGDYIALMCIRNPTHTPTMIASNTDIDFTSDKFKRLFKPVYKIRPDNSHLQISSGDEQISDAQKQMHDMNFNPVDIPVLYGDPQNPYWRIDPFFMEIPEEKEDREALNALIEAINKNIKEISLLPGEIFICDNYRVVHGRSPFTANYDGWDRWLKRLNLVIDLRKSRSVRSKGTSRVFC
jgi:Fe(II)/alpha-ketoglutarate-dependent arginine beta-hydroxylase